MTPEHIHPPAIHVSPSGDVLCSSTPCPRLVPCPQRPACPAGQGRAEPELPPSCSPACGRAGALHRRDMAVLHHTPQVDAIQVPAYPGYESAGTGAQQPLLDNPSCWHTAPAAGLCHSQALCGLMGRLQAAAPGSAATLQTSPGMACPQHGMHFPPPARRHSRAAKPRHSGTRCLTLT